MPTYLSPGVYVEEVDSGSRPIEGVGTAVAAFVGLAASGPLNEPTLVSNWRQFTSVFGDFTGESYLAHSVYGYFLNGGGNCYVVRVGGRSEAASAEASPARARIGDLEVRALEPGPDGNGTTIEVSDPAEGAAEQTVRIVISRGDIRGEHEALPLVGRGNVVNMLNRSRLVRVEVDPAVTQLETLPRGITTLTGGDLVHVDFVRVRRDVAVSAEVPLLTEGDPPGVREGGLLEQLLFNVTVEAMPGNIPNSITVDVSHLALGDQLHVGDLPVPTGVTLQHEDDELVAQVTIPRGMDEGEEGEGEEGEEGEGGEGGGSSDASAEDSGDGEG
jgi:hypothetical protein